MAEPIKPDEAIKPDDGEPGTLGELIESIADAVSERTSKSIFKGLADLLDKGAESSDGPDDDKTKTKTPPTPPAPVDDPPAPLRGRRISWL